jgi:hypothetical protein
MSFTVSSRFEAELKKRIDNELIRLHEELGLGMSVKDYADYKKYTGQIAAMSKVRDEFCDEINKSINEG